MYVLPDNILANPIQIETVQYIESRLVINENQTGSKIKIVMASGKEYEINHTNCKDVQRAMQELAFQIDMACGMSFKPKTEVVNKEVPEEEGTE